MIQTWLEIRHLICANQFRNAKIEIIVFSFVCEQSNNGFYHLFNWLYNDAANAWLSVDAKINQAIDMVLLSTNVWYGGCSDTHTFSQFF